MDRANHDGIPGRGFAFVLLHGILGLVFALFAASINFFCLLYVLLLLLLSCWLCLLLQLLLSLYVGPLWLHGNQKFQNSHARTQATLRPIPFGSAGGSSSSLSAAAVSCCQLSIVYAVNKFSSIIHACVLDKRRLWGDGSIRHGNCALWSRANLRKIAKHFFQIKPVQS